MRDAAGTRLLFLSNGHGEDSIAARIIDALRARAPDSFAIAAWPMVGAGDAYARAGVTSEGARNLLPSEGFATLSPRLFWRDLRAGWIATHWRQVQAARAMRGRFDLAIAVGDVVPIAAASLARIPFFFVGCARSDYYGPGYGYSAFERHLLRSRCRLAFPRDARTAATLSNAGVPVRFVGNPMMDGLDDSGMALVLPGDPLVIAGLPGSRRDAAGNCRRLLALAPALTRALAPRPVVLLVALPDSLGATALAPGAGGADGWAPAAGAQPAGTIGALVHHGGARALLLVGRFADVLRRADLVIGLAGTANEQAVGLGKPLVTFATDGSQGAHYLAMKMRFFGESAVLLPPEPDAIATAVAALVADPDRRARMARAGRERMGGPGATAAIADAIAGLAEDRAPHAA